MSCRWPWWTPPIWLIQFFTGLKVQLFVSPRSEILAAIEEQFAHSEVDDLMAQTTPAFSCLMLALKLMKKTIAGLHKLPHQYLVLADALKAQASDIHIEPTEHYVLVRFRVDGVLRDSYQGIPMSWHAGLTTRSRL